MKVITFKINFKTLRSQSKFKTNNFNNIVLKAEMADNEGKNMGLPYRGSFFIDLLRFTIFSNNRSLNIVNVFEILRISSHS